MAYSKTVEDFLKKNQQRKEELIFLRNLILQHPFEETIKWGMPTYTVDRKNIIGIGGFKNWSCLWFHQGVFLKDKAKVLINAQEGKTSGMRQWRFESLSDIDEDLVHVYLDEAIQNHKDGKQIRISRTKKKIQQIDLPEIFNEMLEKESNLKANFQKMTVSQKIEMINYITEAKRESTKLNRLEKIKTILENGQTLKVLWES